MGGSEAPGRAGGCLQKGREPAIAIGCHWSKGTVGGGSSGPVVVVEEVVGVEEVAGQVPGLIEE